MTAGPVSGGQGKPAAEEVEEHSPTLIKRLKDHFIPRAKQKEVGSTLFLMHRARILTEVKAEAGMRYAADVGAYERMKGHPRRSSQSPSFEGGRKGADGLELGGAPPERTRSRRAGNPVACTHAVTLARHGGQQTTDSARP